MKITAKELFEALGYKRHESENGIQYFSESGVEITFIFLIRRFYKQENFQSLNISVDEFKAIQQQMKELGWIAKEEKQETNLDHYKDEILEECSKNLAVVKGRPKLCYKINCNDCDFKISQIGCHKKVIDWLKQPYKKQKYQLTRFEHELLQMYSDDYVFKDLFTLNSMKEKGLYQNVNGDELIKDILANCEVTE